MRATCVVSADEFNSRIFFSVFAKDGRLCLRPRDGKRDCSGERNPASNPASSAPSAPFAPFAPSAPSAEKAVCWRLPRLRSRRLLQLRIR